MPRPDASMLSCWTGSSQETQPRICRQPDRAGERDDAGDRLTVTLVVGAWCSRPDRSPQVQLQARYFDAGQWHDVVCDSGCELTAAELDRRVGQATDLAWLEAQCLITDVRNRLGTPGNRYLEWVLPDLPAGRLLQYRAVATIGDLDVQACSDSRGLWLVVPDFTADHLVCSRTPEPAPGDWTEYPDNQWWVLLRRDEPAVNGGPAFCHLRLDLIGSTDPDDHGALPPLTMSLGSDTNGGVRTASVQRPGVRGWDDPPGPADLWPIIDRSADSVLLNVPIFGSAPVGAIRIVTGDKDRPGQRVDDVEVAALVGAATTYRPTALMMIHYAIQGFNDLFERPVALYDPPRSFIDVTFEDDQGRFSGRPGRPEDSVPDGYVFALRAQAAYQIRTQWALNGGVLMLLKHGLTDEKFSLLSDQIRSGLISPSNAGFGAHRPPYYGSAANTWELDLGAAMIDNLFGASYDKTYYPDQRIYLAADGEVDAYRGLSTADKLRYLVLDRSTVASVVFPGTPMQQQICLFGEGHGTGDNGNYLWKESRTGLTLLLIEDQFRDQLMAASTDEVGRGQLGRALRRRFMRAVGSPADGKRKIYVYGDDLDHACGDGWFDGSYPGGAQIFYTRAYLAALRWIRHHPWVQAVTVSDADFAPEQYLQPEPLTVSSAICPSVDPKGAEGFDAWGRAIHFDTWYEFWKTTRSRWLDCSLGELSDTLEQRLVSWPARYRDNGLYRLAWMYFLAYTHESMWSKQPLEDGKPNDDRRTWEPEDFVISESLQQRGAWVYLNASIWASSDCQAELAAGPNRTYVIARSTPDAAGGPLLRRLLEEGSADPYWPGPHPPDQRGRYLEPDPLDTLVLYNRRALLVVDRNGGRVTNIFSLVGDLAISVSGTFKAQQFLSFLGAEALGCDGQAVQNTVFGPNHAYVAADVRQAQWERGVNRDQRPPERDQPCWYPDNFNSYRCTGVDGPVPAVTCELLPATSTAPLDPESFTAACAEDGAARRRGDPGIVCRANEPAAPFSKSFTLQDNVIGVRYENVPAGHVVTNEFCVDLENSVLRGDEQRKSVTGGAVTLTNAELAVTVTLVSGCEFDDCATHVPASGVSTPRDWGALHRVLTDDLRIVCPAGGSFEYRIDLP